MSEKFVIQWKSKINGRAGRGTKLFDRHDAERLIQELNTEYPTIEHELAKPQPHPPREQSERQEAKPEPEQIVSTE